jgi:PRC-barrel domain
MQTVEGIESWRGQDVLDVAGEKAGRLEEVYYDGTGQEAVLISIKRGRLGRQVKLAPLADFAVSRDYVRLPFTGEQINGSPDVTVGDELTAEQGAAVCALFGSLQGSFEALADLAAIQGVACVRMAEDEVVLGLVGRRLEQQLELAPDVIGHRDGAGRHA